MIEELEHRVLLAAGALDLLAAELPTITAAISPFQNAPYGGNRTYGPPMAGISRTEGMRANSGEVALPTMLLLSTRSLPVLEVDPLNDLSAPPGPSGAVDAGNFAHAMIGPELASPALYVDPSASPTRASNPTEQGEYAALTPSTPAMSSGAQAFMTDPSNDAAWTSNDVARHLDLPGILDPGRTSMTYEIAVDSAPQVLGMSIHYAGEGNEMPVLGEVQLLSQTGVPLAEIGPQNGPSAGPPQAMTLYLKNAPAGGHLDIQVLAAADTTSGSESVTPASSTVSSASLNPFANWNVSFVLDVQKQENASLPQDAAAAFQNAGAIGTLIAATPITAAAFSTSSRSALNDAPDESTLTAELPATTRVIDASTATAIADEDTTASEGNAFTRITTGPLASRSAGPLGPTLASIDADPTQAVDRHERALFQEIDGLAATDMTQSGYAGPGWRTNDQQAGSGMPGTEVFDSQGHLESIVTVSSRGGFPLKVTARGHGPRGELTELWATLDAGANGQTAGEQPRLHGPMVSFISAPLSTSDIATGPDANACPDYVKAACGLAIGLALTSGPLFPDLIASRPRRLREWVSMVFGHSSTSGAGGTRPAQDRRGKSWALRLFGARG